MQLQGNTILITGGANGIGLALTERFLERGNEVIICGRREERLRAAQSRWPQLHVRCCDVANEGERKSLHAWAIQEFPRLNVLINNAGVQESVDLQAANPDWRRFDQEIAINLTAPIHLSMLFISHLTGQNKPAIINISSGLAFRPPAWAPVYGATKAGMHSFTFSLRLQLASAGIEVVEVIPPAINTDLGGVGLHTFGMPVDTFADAVLEGLAAGSPEIGCGYTLGTEDLSRKDLEDHAQQIWQERIKAKPSH